MIWGRFARFFTGDFVSEPWPATDPPPDDPAQLGLAAQRLLEDPVLKLAFDRLEQKLADSWRRSQVGDNQGREATYRLLWAVEGVKAELRAMIGTGRVQNRT